MIPTTQCIKVTALRKTYKTQDIDLEKWLQDNNNLYTGRHGRIFIGSGEKKKIFHYSSSKWANPYKIPEFTLEESLRLYEEHIRKNLIEDIKELEGKVLGCFCDQSQPCHIKVLVKLYKEVNR